MHKTGVLVKVRAKSVHRNRLKRLVRQAFINLKSRINSGGQCLVIIKKAPIDDAKIIQNQLEHLLKQAQFL